MKTPEKISYKRLFQGMVFGFAVVMMMFATVGCSKKDSNNGPFPGYGAPGYPGMPGGPGYGGPGASGVGVDQFGNEVYLEFSSAGPTYGSQNPYYITGPVGVFGNLHLQGIQCYSGGFGGMTYAPAGNYQVLSMQPANAVSGVVQGAYVVARGPVELMVFISFAHIQPPVIGMNYNQIGQALTATMIVQTVQGAPCNASMNVHPY